jgi:hypothetical protein
VFGMVDGGVDVHALRRKAVAEKVAGVAISSSTSVVTFATTKIIAHQLQGVERGNHEIALYPFATDVLRFSHPRRCN